MWSWFLDLLYPPVCASCDEPLLGAGPFCWACAVSVEPHPPSCAHCRQLHGRSGGCGHWLAAHAAAEFGGAVARAIRRLKFQARPDLATPLASLWARPPTVDLVVPVPLHPRRLRSRGFNQAAVLALALAARWRLTDEAGRRVAVSTAALARIRDTPPQTSLGPAERNRNLRGAFVANPRQVQGRRILLVDDVLTTGATVGSCARALYRAGADDVLALTLARAVP